MTCMGLVFSLLDITSAPQVHTLWYTAVHTIHVYFKETGLIAEMFLMHDL